MKKLVLSCLFASLFATSSVSANWFSRWCGWDEKKVGDVELESKQRSVCALEDVKLPNLDEEQQVIFKKVEKALGIVDEKGQLVAYREVHFHMFLFFYKVINKRDYKIIVPDDDVREAWDIWIRSKTDKYDVFIDERAGKPFSVRFAPKEQ